MKKLNEIKFKFYSREELTKDEIEFLFLMIEDKEKIIKDLKIQAIIHQLDNPDEN